MFELLLPFLNHSEVLSYLQHGGTSVFDTLVSEPSSVCPTVVCSFLHQMTSLFLHKCCFKTVFAPHTHGHCRCFPSPFHTPALWHPAQRFPPKRFSRVTPTSPPSALCKQTLLWNWNRDDSTVSPDPPSAHDSRTLSDQTRRLTLINGSNWMLCFLQVSMAMTSQSSCSSMSNHTKERVTMAKVTLENFYSNLISQHEEREMR